MGEVYRAKDTRLDRAVAIKVLPTRLSSSEEGRKRFEREAKTISQLSHPHICALYDVGREGETEYLVMELLEGETLGRAAREGCAAAGADAALRGRDRRRSGQGAPAGDRAPGPQARQRDADEVGSEAARFRAGQGDSAGDAAKQHDRTADAAGTDAGRHDPRDVPVHGAGAAGGQGSRCANGHLRARGSPLRDGNGEEGVFRNQPGLADLLDHDRGPTDSLLAAADDAAGIRSDRAQVLSRRIPKIAGRALRTWEAS